jgi:hypothetical protein
MKPQSPAQALLLGRDHIEYGAVHVETVGERSACAISVGSDRDSPSLAAKGDSSVPNEDCLLVVDDGALTLLAVADGHFGIEASHELIERTAARFRHVPEDGAELASFVNDLTYRPPSGSYGSATSFVLGIVDRNAGRGFGVSYGDSTFALIGADKPCRGLNPKNGRFVTLARPSSIALANAEPFFLAFDPGDVVLAFTDGIDECHYGEPETSLTADVMDRLFAESAGDPRTLVETVAAQALAGVDGNPGGQDNLVIAATRI